MKIYRKLFQPRSLKLNQLALTFVVPTMLNAQPIPESIEEVSEEIFDELVEAGEFTVIDMDRLQEADEERRFTNEQNREIAEMMASQNSELQELLERIPTLSEERSDGTLAIDVEKHTGEAQSVALMGRESIYATIAEGVRKLPTFTNQMGLYQSLYSNLPSDFLTEQADRLGLTAPGNIENGDIAELIRNTDLILFNLDLLRIYIDLEHAPPLARPASCRDEVGAGRRTDQSGSCRPGNGGLFAKANYPMKWYATCIKNQGKRGTCTAFAAMGAFETGIALNYNRWMNMSEQAYYNQALQVWWPRTYGDGLGTNSMDEMIRRRYKPSLEHHWNYNPSYRRIDGGIFNGYSDSCVGYSGPHCSDFTHQATAICKPGFLGIRTCAFKNSVQQTSFRATRHTYFWDWFNKDRSIKTAEAYSLLKVPMVAALNVVPSFDKVGRDGFVGLPPEFEWSRGGHAVQVMAAIPNHELPQGINPGLGGGYFVIKNSWGNCVADGGYYYIPYQWAKYHFTSLETFSGVTR